MWQQKFDHNLQLNYYVNLDDGLISFDLPCEVQIQKKLPKQKENILHRITSALTLRRLSSKASDDELQQGLSVESESGFTTADQSPSEPNGHLLPMSGPPLPLGEKSISRMPSDSYLLEKAFNLQPHENEVASVSSDESIQSFYLDIAANDMYYDYDRTVYCDEKPFISGNGKNNLPLENNLINDDYEKELERQELRLQILKELY